VGLGSDVLGESSQILTEVGDSLVGEEIVVPSPGETLVAESARSERLEQLHDVKVGDTLELVMVGSVGSILGAHNTLGEEVLVHEISGLLRNQHSSVLVVKQK